jgi:hypothetical protein
VAWTAAVRKSTDAIPGAWNGLTRGGLLILGGLVALQSSNELDASKVVYLVVAAICVAGSVLAVAARRNSPEVAALRPLLLSSIALAGLVALSLPVAYAGGTPVASWLRDAAAYSLMAAVPFVALDMSWSGPRRWLLGLALIAGGLSTTSFVIYWLGARNIVELPIDRLTLPSGQLTSALFATLIALSLAGGSRRLMWAIALGIDIALFVLVGGRGRLALLILPLVMAAVAWPVGRQRIMRTLGVQAITAVVAFSGLHAVISPSSVGEIIDGGPPPPSGTPGTSPGPSPTPNPLDARIGSIPGLIADVAADASFRERIAQTFAAWDVFVESPALGAGPGRAIEWSNYAGQTVRSYNLDTPVMVAAKFGIVGTAVIFAWMLSLLRFTWGRVRVARASWVTLAPLGYALTVLYSWIFITPVDDKGFSFALMILVALGLVSGRLDKPRHVPTTPDRLASPGVSSSDGPRSARVHEGRGPRDEGPMPEDRPGLRLILIIDPVS